MQLQLRAEDSENLSRRKKAYSSVIPEAASTADLLATMTAMFNTNLDRAPIMQIETDLVPNPRMSKCSHKMFVGCIFFKKRMRDYTKPGTKTP